jgi:hypothetical protein
MITAGRYTTETAVSAIEPAQRIRAGVPLNAFDRSTAYGGGAHGYSCSPLLASLAKAAGPFFCDDLRVLPVQPRQPFPVPWLGPLSSPRPWRPADAAEGGPSVMLRFDLPDGRVVLAEIAARLYVMTGRMIGRAIPSRTRPMLDAVDKAYKTYNEGRLAFRQYFATCGHVEP